LGGRARLILESPQVDEVLTVAQIMAEVEEYAGFLARKKTSRKTWCFSRWLLYR
jgi:hypothetical protein